jgi:protein gp37
LNDVENTAIEWADHTFNPWVGCTKVSPACDHCYAEAWANRTGHPELWNGERRRTSRENWKRPYKWDKLAAIRGIRFKVFCASLADVFDVKADVEWRADLFAMIAKTPNLDWLLLTKRIGNARQHLPEPWWKHGLPPNIWIGATVVTQEEADRDIPKLLQVPARVRFLSMEPLLGPVNFRWAPYAHEARGQTYREYLESRAAGVNEYEALRQIQWIIVGGESGGHARPMRLSWVRSLRDQCAAASVPFFFKQHGEWAPALSGTFYHPLHDGPTFAPRAGGKDTHDFGDGHGAVRIGKKNAGRMLDGRIYGELPA